MVELAEASGLRLVQGRSAAPLTASTYGTGELIRCAFTEGLQRIVLGVGGSATTDGGTGLAQALGVSFFDRRGRELPPGGAALQQLHTIDVDHLDPRIHDLQLDIATDVNSSLLGRFGAAKIYGQQKGAGPADVEQLELGLERFSSVVANQFGIDLAGLPGAGAGGGAAGGAVALLGGRIVSGTDLILDLLDVPQALHGADLVITGEGSLDQQSLAGKAPWGIAQAAIKAGIPTVAFVGQSLLTHDESERAGFSSVHALSDIEPDLELCQQDAARLLTSLVSNWSSRRGVPR